MKRIKWWVIIVPVVAVLLLFKYTKKGPVEIVSEAGLRLSEAEKYKAMKFSSLHYKKARLYFDSAMISWYSENEKLLFLRDYQRTEYCAKKSLLYSNQAINLSLENSIKLESQVKHRISKMKNEILDLNNRLSVLPFNERNTTILAKTKLKLNESVLLYQQARYFLAEEKLDTIESTLLTLKEEQKKLLIAYFDNYEQWKQMVNKTVSDSKKKGSYCIIIDKFNRRCFVYNRGIIKENFSVELGSNWIGDKNYAGDKTTPEGYYKIIAKKNSGESKYHKALLINYPNDDDRKRFLLNKKKGIIKTNDQIGNLIEIHGNGGKGTDWTDGCIALNNDDMDILFEISQISTPVTIVGSVISLEEINKGLNE